MERWTLNHLKGGDCVFSVTIVAVAACQCRLPPARGGVVGTQCRTLRTPWNASSGT